jgi:hypothetical protein
MRAILDSAFGPSVVDGLLTSVQLVLLLILAVWWQSAASGKRKPRA